MIQYMGRELLKDEAKVYKVDDLFVTPYPAENILASAFLRMEQQGLVPIVFHEGCNGIGWFINEFTHNQSILALWVRESGQMLLAGLAWFNQRWKIGGSGMNRAEAGYVFFKEHQSPKKTLVLAAMGMEWAFDHLNVHVITGMTPENNKLACYFLRWLGMSPSGPIESLTTFPDGGPVCGVYVSTMTKERWQTVKSKWFNCAVDNPT